MGAVTGMLGLNGGAGGTGFDKPGQAQITPLSNPAQINTAYEENLRSIGKQESLLSALQGQNGIQNQSNVFNQLQGVANGTGPNPAMAMLNQQTGANVANQAALMAGQRGAGANVGLLARQAGQQGGALQQQAVGQGATMQANQSLGALGQMGQMAGQQVANQMGATNSLTGFNQSEQQNLLNALSQQNQQHVASQASVNSGNAGLAGNTMGMAGSLIGGAGNALGAGIGNMFGGLAKDVGSAGGGTDVVAGEPMAGHYFNHGGQVGPQSSIVKHIHGMSTQPKAAGGMVKVALSPNEKVVAPNKVEKAAGGKVEAKTVPGKAMVAGDSLKNDTVKTELPPGSIVIPRTKAGNEKDAAQFVRSVLAKRGKK